MAAIIRNPAMMQELENGNDDYGRYGGEVLPTPLSKIDPPYAYRDHSLNYRKLHTHTAQYYFAAQSNTKDLYDVDFFFRKC